MTTAFSENLLPLPLNTEKPSAIARNANKGFVFDKVMFDPEALSALQSVFNASCQNSNASKGFTKTASVKFMITIQDESDLQELGYSKAQIYGLKPHEAADILQARTKVEPYNSKK